MQSQASDRTVGKKRRVLSDSTNGKCFLPSSAPLSPVSVSLPKGWIAERSTTSGEVYYRNQVTDDAQWDIPTKPAVEERATAVHQAQAAIRELGDLGVKVIP